MRHAVFSALLGLAVAGTEAVAEEKPGAEKPAAEKTVALGTVVELYTSQGCSSCPPADAYLHQLSTEPGVIALGLHVDYWDYIGWTDKFGNPKYTARQKAYAHAGGSNAIYTPQMIVGGVERVEGTDPARVEGAIRRDQQTGASVLLHLQRQGDDIRILAQPLPGLDKPLRVELVRYRPDVRVDIERGENAGRVLDYTNVVTAWTQLGQWDGVAALDLTAPIEGEEPVVVILQAEGPGRIYAAAQMK